MNLHVGTSGYSYKEWKGPFYPEKMKPADMLAYYGERLSAVEINNTFYRLPRKNVLENWAAQVPESFRFSIKASRRITHFKRLKDAGDETAYLIEATQVLGTRLGVLLFQLPPNLAADLERFDAFLALLPEGLPAAFEFRHESWEDEAVYERLRTRNFATVTVDTEEGDTPALVKTAGWGYLRLRRPDYASRDLERWASEVASTGWSDAFVFFKHEDEGAAPRMATEFTAHAATAGGQKRPRKVGTRKAGTRKAASGPKKAS